MDGILDVVEALGEKEAVREKDRYHFKLDSFGKALCIRIRERREYLKISREEAARAIGMSVAGYGHLETGRSAFKTRHLVKLAEALKVPMSYFLPLTGATEGEDGEEDGARYANRYLVIDREDSQTVRLSPEEEELLGRLLDMIRRGRAPR